LILVDILLIGGIFGKPFLIEKYW